MDPRDDEALRQMAKMALTLFRSLIRDGAKEHEAVLVTTSIIAGFIQGANTEDDNKKKEK